MVLGKKSPAEVDGPKNKIMSNNCPEEQPHWPRSFGPKDGLIKKKKWSGQKWSNLERAKSGTGQKVGPKVVIVAQGRQVTKGPVACVSLLGSANPARMKGGR